jgi:mannose-1-phosphate guanylyltransferase
MRHAVILAGGSGVRFWPLSRRRRPKQFLPLTGEISLLRATFERLLPVVPAERVWVVTGARLAARVRRELPEVARPHVLVEPAARNTAPAIHLAAVRAAREDRDAVLLVVPADAWVPRAGAYRRALAAALRAAETGSRLVLVGVKPTRAETGYGYIEPGKPLGRGGVRAVARFVEKPSAARARRFLAGGRHLWNCGIFAWRSEVFREAVERHLPDLAEAFARLPQGRLTAPALERAYAAAPSISVDHGILEHASNVAVVPATFPWDDLGSWGALERLGRGGSFARGRVVALDSPGLVAWAEKGTVAVVGIPDAVVVHTPDATLVVAKDRAQEVRKVVEALEKTPEGRSLVEGETRP